MLALDNETTGLLKPDAIELKFQPYITEIYMCEFNFDGEIGKEFYSLVKPPVPIPEIVSKITGIDDNMVRKAPTFIEIYDDLSDFVLGHKTIFAHNCAFDINTIRTELIRHELEFNFPYPPYQVCTVEASFSIMNKRLDLQKLYTICTGKTIDSRHRAKGDVHAMIECIVWLKKEGFIHDIFN